MGFQGIIKSLRNRSCLFLKPVPRIAILGACIFFNTIEAVAENEGEDEKPYPELISESKKERDLAAAKVRSSLNRDSVLLHILIGAKQGSRYNMILLLNDL